MVRDVCTKLRYKFALVVVAILLIAAVDVSAREGSKNWIVLENCRLIVNPANDGDSFHASAGDKEYIFRLYLVDAPEPDALAPGRLIEQAKYFGLTMPQTIEVGEAAKAFTRDKLSEPFTVFTHMSDAMGRSRMERLYAFVQTRDGDLGERLVRNGLARNYSFIAAPPGLKISRLEIEKLQQLENQARQEKVGGWGIDAGQLNMRAPSTGFGVFVSNKKAQPGVRPSTTGFAGVSATPALNPLGFPINSVEEKTSHAKEKTPLGRIDINTATEKELTTVPAIGHVMAARIIAARPFRSADDLKRVSGIGDKKYARMRLYFQ
jgi:DNA uptake protein ComE-like DNA-binding protein